MKMLNLGAGFRWKNPDWTVLDHKIMKRKDCAWRLPFPDGHFDIIFSSHMIEHIPHTKMDEVLFECNRCLKPNGLIRLLCPDLEILAKAYVRKDRKMMSRFLIEDPTIRNDLGIGSSFMNFLVSNGNDSLLISRNGELIAGYAHVYGYDAEMLKSLLVRNGFKQFKKCRFLESSNSIFKEPLHPIGQPAVWKDECYWGQYEELTGFDRDPLTSLIVEARKERLPEKRVSYFGTPRKRGLDPVNFSYTSMLLAFLIFSYFKGRRHISLRIEYCQHLMIRIRNKLFRR